MTETRIFNNGDKGSKSPTYGNSVESGRTPGGRPMALRAAAIKAIADRMATRNATPKEQAAPAGTQLPAPAPAPAQRAAGTDDLVAVGLARQAASFLKMLAAEAVR